MYSQHEDLQGNDRIRAMGPLIESATSPDGDAFFAIRPLYSRTQNAELDKVQQEVLWPLASSKHWLGEHRWWVGPVWAWNHDVSDPESQSRLWVVPVWSSGRSRNGKTYAGLFPLYGKTRDMAGKDEVNWVLFPLYFNTKVNDVESKTWLWPIFSHTEGEGQERFRVFPFYGKVTWRDRVKQHFVLWPFWTSVDYLYPDHPGTARMLWPFYGQLKTDAKTVHMVFPPFFRVENEEMGRKIYLPWPIYQRQTGADIDKLYLFPLIGRKTFANTQSDFLLWPVFWHQTIQRGDEEIERWLAMPVWQGETRTTDGEVTTRKAKLWPLASYRREGDVSRFRLVDLWPSIETPAIERNYAPLWSVVRADRNGEGHDREVGWGVWRDLKRSDDKRFRSLFPVWDEWREDGRSGWNVLKGLIGREQGPTGARWRVLWLFTVGGEA